MYTQRLRDVQVDKMYLQDKIFILSERYKRLPQLKYLLSVSCGKDSVVMMHSASIAKLNIIPVHYYIVDGLSYNNDVIDKMVAITGVKINKMLSSINTKMKNADLLCINKVWDLQANNKNPFKDNEKLSMLMFNTDYNLIGIKKNDSPIRRVIIQKNGWFFEKAKKIYPLFDWSDKDVWMYIKYFDLPINKCYDWFGRSQDVVNIEHIMPLKQHSPDDYLKFCEEFPLIEPMVWIREKRLAKG